MTVEDKDFVSDLPKYSSEQDVLLDPTLSNAARVLYLMGLRPYVNREGLIGYPCCHSARSYSSVAHLLSQYRHEDGEELGHKPVYCPTKGEVRGIWRQLERVGLVEKLDDLDRGGRHLYRLPWVRLDLNSQVMDVMEQNGCYGCSPVLW